MYESGAPEFATVEPNGFQVIKTSDPLFEDTAIVVRRTEGTTTVHKLIEPRHVRLADQISDTLLCTPSDDREIRLAQASEAKFAEACEMARCIGEFTLSGTRSKPIRTATREKQLPVSLIIEHL